MRILIYSDPHWSQYSSILRSNTDRYSTRLENLIWSINWAEEQAAYANCQAVITCGDFFDSSVINSMEASALQHIRWAPISHVFLTGNHETTLSNLEYSTADLFNLCPNSRVISTPENYMIEGADCEFCFLPYILERDRKELGSYFPNINDNPHKRIIFSHNDLKDIQYGNFVSTEGFSLSEIEANCDLFFNGHIHHYSKVTEKIYNIGNLTGQNFTEDFSYKHGVIILDTDSMEVNFIENPYAINFWRIDCTRINDDKTFEQRINQLSGPCVLMIKVNEDFANNAKQIMKNLVRPNILEYRILVERIKNNDNKTSTTIEQIDHLQQFRDYVLSNIGNSKLIQEELEALLK